MKKSLKRQEWPSNVSVLWTLLEQIQMFVAIRARGRPWFLPQLTNRFPLKFDLPLTASIADSFNSLHQIFSLYDANKDDLFIKMNGRKVYEFALKHVPEVVKM